MEEINVSEPMSVKAQMVKSATEAATMPLKIDDMIASSKSKPPTSGPGGMEGGVPGGMPPMM
jgi:chaperonin GroEL (HSP60 family)